MMPNDTGFFWGRWHSAAPGTADKGDMCSGTDWEVHMVFENAFDKSDPDYLLALVPGVEKAQPLSAFEWGPRVVQPKNLPRNSG